MKRILSFSILGIILFFSIFNLFFNLEKFPVSSWDEARHGVSAYEMVQNNSYIVTTYLDEIDYWNSKPPLTLWTIGLSYNIFGYNNFSLRFFSALMGLLTLLVVFYIGRILSDNKTGIISVLVLITSQGFLFDHAIRNGDSDAIVTFLLALVILFIFLHNKTKKIRYVYFSVMLLPVLFLTKSFVMVFGVLLLTIYIFLERKSMDIKIRDLFLFGVIIILPVALWAGARYAEDGAAFFLKMYEQDLFKRSLQSVEGHYGDIMYYPKVIFRSMWLWVFFVFLLLFFIFQKKTSIFLNKKHLFLWLWFLIPFVIVTFIKTKCHWYIIPAYPALAVIVGDLIVKTYRQLRHKKVLSYTVIFLAGCVFVINQISITKKILDPPSNTSQNVISSVSPEKSNSPLLFYDRDDFTQGNVFVAKVVKNFKPKYVELDIIDITEKFQGPFYIFVSDTEKIPGKFKDAIIAEEKGKGIMFVKK